MPEPMTIQGVPATVDRSQVIEMIASLGIDPHRVRSLQINIDQIRVEVFARGEDGKLLLDGFERNAVASHTITIPIRDK